MLEYTYVNHPAAEKNQAIKIKNSEYGNIVFTFGKVSFYEVDDTPHIKFDYNVLEGEDPESEDFTNLLGDIVVDILEREFKSTDEGVFVDESDYRKDDTEQSTEE
tara:strand:- start:1260 stop:1574 length:315 start_codon:yes stop_codon:yes gene_type:complete